MTYLIYLIGRAGTGKYTIAKEMAKQNYIICDNHNINNPIFSLMHNNGSDPYPEFIWEAIDGIRQSVYNFLAQEKTNNYILTNVLYENTGDREIFEQVENIARVRGSVFVPVILTITEEENVKRITNKVRTKCYKSIDPSETKNTYPLIKINHPNLLELDVTNFTAKRAAGKILKYITRL